MSSKSIDIFATVVLTLTLSGAVHGKNRRPIVVDLIQKHGYPVEEHNDISTEDGYLLTMQRIPRGKNNSDRVVGEKPAVLLVHGVVECAEHWVIMGPGRALAFLLADLGYDVWLANARGTDNAKKHVRLDPARDLRYWQFSWHEIGRYDLPAKIDYVLKTTKQKKLFYVGHSQGAAAFFVMMSERAEYNEKIRTAVVLAPAVFMGNLGNIFLRLYSYLEVAFLELVNLVGGFEFRQFDLLLLLCGQTICERTSPNPELCENVVFLLGGYDSTEVDREVLPTMLNSTVSTCSFKQILHFGQSIASGDFRQFDYGPIANMRKYGSTLPPKYDMGKTTVPVAVFYGKNDALVPVAGARKLIRSLPNVIYDGLVGYPLFNHMDFCFAKSSRKLVYDRLFEILAKYRNN